MNRLPVEVQRLYGQAPAAVLAVSLPAGWEQLSAVWRGVQADLDLPAPAIAVSGDDALQLWFAFAAPTPEPVRARFLAGLQARYLPDVPPARWQAISAPAELPAPPCVEVAPQRWSAFVTPDLAAVFAETPWLDIPPGDEGQAAILRPLAPIRPAALEAALARLDAVDGAALGTATGSTAPATPAASNAPAAPGALAAAPAALPKVDADPARFLAGVVNDPTAPLALRIEAAKILLQDSARG